MASTCKSIDPSSAKAKEILAEIKQRQLILAAAFDEILANRAELTACYRELAAHLYTSIALYEQLLTDQLQNNPGYLRDRQAWPARKAIRLTNMARCEDQMLVLMEQTKEMRGTCKPTLSPWDIASINISLDREYERIRGALERAYPGADDGENSRSTSARTDSRPIIGSQVN